MKGWAISRDGEALILHRAGRRRMDVSASTALTGTHRPARLAHAIRQDLWRALQTTRGFSPVIRIETGPAQTRITAGGQIDGPRAPALSQIIQDLLNSPSNRNRWQHWAGR